jgi:NAD(P)-dependent dehydrogenase (short-subunit alcohol dehydrogenase family)
LSTDSSSTRRVALITGGTTGIGLATARVLHADGYAVVVTGRNPETLAAAERALPSDVLVLRADARSLADAAQVAATLKERFGRLDLAFLNAGIGQMTPFEAVDEEAFDKCFDVNVKGQVFTLQKVLPLLTRGSSVVFNAALGAHKGHPGWSIASATKGALLSLSRALAVELAPRGIRVNAVTPGPIDTPAISKLGLPASALEGFRQHMTEVVPLGRIGSDEEVARAVAFLASPGAGFITGAELVIDGGLGIALP